VIFECVINVSEGRDQIFLDALATNASPVLLDRHSDANHHRSVFTLAGMPEDLGPALRALATASVSCLDIATHGGAHPRLGVLDVVPFVPILPGRPPTTDLGSAVRLRNEFARWLSATFAVPSFLYGPLPGGQIRTLPQVRRQAFTDLPPDFGPGQPHPTAGATAVGARPVLVAYNLWVSSVALAQRVARQVRSPMVRALGLEVGERAQVSCNLIDPTEFGPAQLYDLVDVLIRREGGQLEGAELVGLIPQAILKATAASRWAQLGLSADKTIEARLLT
jgi:glutamate formiminotransferase